MLFQKNKIGNSFEENETTIRKYDAAVRRCWIMIRCAQHDKTNDYRCNHTCFHFICCFVAFPAIWERIAGISSPEKQKETENEMEWMKRVRERERERERERVMLHHPPPPSGWLTVLPPPPVAHLIYIHMKARAASEKRCFNFEIIRISDQLPIAFVINGGRNDPFLTFSTDMATLQCPLRELCFPVLTDDTHRHTHTLKKCI